MMSGLPLETCWAFNERWNYKFYCKVASGWLFLLSHITMHGSMNIKPIQNVHIQLHEYWKSESVFCDFIRFGCVLQNSFPCRYQICFSPYGQDRVLHNVAATSDENWKPVKVSSCLSKQRYGSRCYNVSVLTFLCRRWFATAHLNG
jgi:hypothetical protein